jgi:hypothetical protein
LDRIAEWRAANNPATASLRDLRTAQSGAINDLGAFELVGVWGLLP